MCSQEFIPCPLPSWNPSCNTKLLQGRCCIVTLLYSYTYKVFYRFPIHFTFLVLFSFHNVPGVEKDDLKILSEIKTFGPIFTRSLSSRATTHKTEAPDPQFDSDFSLLHPSHNKLVPMPFPHPSPWKELKETHRKYTEWGRKRDLRDFGKAF